MPNDLLESALRYAAEGCPVLPCKPKTKIPLLKKGFHEASTDPTQIREWWERYPDANVAVVPGEGRCVVLDIDGEVGRASLEGLGLPEPGRIVGSPGKGGGFHYWYRLPDGQGIVGNGRPWDGIDIRGHNGYVMVPPSIHPTGAPYTYGKDEDLTKLPASYLRTSSETGECRPMAEIRALLRRVTYKADKDSNDKLAFLIADILRTPEGDRHNEMISAVWDLAAMVFAGTLTHEQVMQYGEAYEEACQPYDVGADFSSALIGAYRKLPAPEGGKLFLKLASEGKPRKAEWLWQERLLKGAFGLVAGREGIGKSTVLFDAAARLTRGALPGDLEGKPQGVVILATEDSWEEKILPSLMYTDADLSKIGYITTGDEDWFTDVVFPDDLHEVERVCEQINAGMLILDPLTSRISNGLDTHKDSDVRRALEPVAGFARKTGISVVGIMHVNKSGADPLNSIMGSKAFTATARSVLFAAQYDDDTYGLSVIKSNSGPSNQGTDLYQIQVGSVADDIPAVRINWSGWSSDTMAEITAPKKESSQQQSRPQQAAEWLTSYLSADEQPAKDVIEAAKTAGFGKDLVYQAVKLVKGYKSVHAGMPRQAFWSVVDSDA